MQKILTTILLALLGVSAAPAQAMYTNSATVPDTGAVQAVKPRATDPRWAELRSTSLTVPTFGPDSTALSPRVIAYFEEAFAMMDSVEYDTVMVIKPLPRTFFGPAVYREFEYADTVSPFLPEYSGEESLRWIEEANAQNRTMRRIQRALFFEYPQAVKYNINMLPEAPKVFHAVVNPEDHTIEIKEIVKDAPAAPTIDAKPVRKRHWIRNFSASLQFSQAYVSPNWYQGGNSNVNMLSQLNYNVKLNDAYHPNLLFETTFQYKLGMNNSPEDKVRDYNISDDLFQINTTFGLRAVKRWYYSFTGQFKTQLFNSYPSNSRDIQSSFMSPGELTVGVGMTYNYSNPKNTFSVNASLAPLSYNLKTCINDDIDPGRFGIDAGHHTRHHFGSSAEVKLFWRLAYNITYEGRIFMFTDYENFQADWENKINFDINRFLTTQLYVHFRYDSNTPKCDDPDWKKFQVKEILSIGFSYRFASI